MQDMPRLITFQSIRKSACCSVDSSLGNERVQSLQPVDLRTSNTRSGSRKAEAAIRNDPVDQQLVVCRKASVGQRTRQTSGRIR